MPWTGLGSNKNVLENEALSVNMSERGARKPLPPDTSGTWKEKKILRKVFFNRKLGAATCLRIDNPKKSANISSGEHNLKS